MVYYDRMDWHYKVEYPANLPLQNGGTHIGMFLAWIIENDMLGQAHREYTSDLMQKVLRRECTGREFLIHACGEKLWNKDLNEEGNRFAQYYYDNRVGSTSNYIDDYCQVFGYMISESVYEIEDTWENYDKLKQVIDRRYEEWKLNDVFCEQSVC